MSLSTSGRTWDEASSPSAVALARRYESAWNAAGDRSRRPDLAGFLVEAGDRPGARLALLRADLTLRWEVGERPDPRDYRRRFPGLGDEAFVALVYEEFCLREETGEAPDAADYLARHSEVAISLRRVLDIHGLVGAGDDSGESTLSRSLPPHSSAVAFPQAGETIAGFRLMGELGRGAFARVFRALERQLADRPVALKVARTGSREPQTLARLQHTHIVPVYSYRTDPATGLHLLCMPYLGRVTLARVLADPKVKVARSGADLVAALDRLGDAGTSTLGRGSGRSALARRTYPQAIAWWGARMAEALDHAHDRGVLHRDVKPSNVLVTDDGMPMLLDFNLARETVLDAEDDALPGGTLDYMAPEHIDELTEGVVDRVDARSDVYGLGVLLYEALMGSRPFPAPCGASSAGELLRRAAADRLQGAPRPRATRPDVPAALEAVVLRCLEPLPDNRYGSAAELAADLQAVADDHPLKFAHEPWPDRAYRWARRHRRALAAAVPVLLAVAGLAVLLIRAQDERSRRWSQVKGMFDEAVASETAGDLERAKVLFQSAARIAEGSTVAKVNRSRLQAGPRDDLATLRQKALFRHRMAERNLWTRQAARDLDTAADHLRFRLIGFGGALKSAARDLDVALKPFRVFEAADWTVGVDLTEGLDADSRAALVAMVDQLLFLHAVALDKQGDPGSLRRAAEVCENALRFVRPVGPWLALRARLAARIGGEPVPSPVVAPARIGDEPSALGCFQWGALRLIEKDPADALPWLKQAVRLEEGNPWYQFYLGLAHDSLTAASPDALRHYDAAVALQPRSPYIRFTRARFFRIANSWGVAREEFQRALADFQALPSGLQDRAFESQTRLELGLARQSLGDLAGARADYAAVVAAEPTSRYAHAARLNRAKLDVDAGATRAARAEYDALVSSDPDDVPARLGRAMLALQSRDPAAAEKDLDGLLGLDFDPTPADRADALSLRTLARLALGRAEESAVDAEEALRLHPGPKGERLLTRALLALGRTSAVTFDRPEDVEALPFPGAPLRADLKRLIDRLRHSVARAVSPGGELRMRLTLAVALSALRDPSAGREADRAVALAPLSSQVYRARARVRLADGQTSAARLDADRALARDPDDPRAWDLRGEVFFRSGDALAALADFDRALALGGEGAVRGRRAAALLAIGDAQGSVRDWTRVLDHDPADPRAYLGRAEAFLVRGQWDQALADLEQAVGWAEGRPALDRKIVAAYVRCLPHRPDRFARVFTLLRRAWADAQNN